MKRIEIGGHPLLADPPVTPNIQRLIRRILLDVEEELWRRVKDVARLMRRVR